MQFPPQDFNESVKKLCDELVPSGVPLIVRCSPVEGGAVYVVLWLFVALSFLFIRTNISKIQITKLNDILRIQ